MYNAFNCISAFGRWHAGDANMLDYVYRNDYDRHVFRMQKNTQGSRGTWDNVKKKSVMLVSLDVAQFHPNDAKLC